jgi:hypothetical protein
MIDRLVENGRYCGMEMNVVKTTLMRILWEPFPVQIMTGEKELVNVEYFRFLSGTITDDARCTHEIKSKCSMTKVTFNKEKPRFTSKLDH